MDKFDPDLEYRAYSVLEVKADETKTDYLLEGMASTPTLDNQGDIMDPKGAVFHLPLPLLWQHDSKKPIGHVVAASSTSKGISIKAKIPRIMEPGLLKDRLDEAWQTIKYGLVKGLSIGFRGMEADPIKDEKTGMQLGFHFKKWKWFELSAVTIPANMEATIMAIKSADVALLKELEVRALRILPATKDLPMHKGFPIVRLK